ncbi:hypothetical protein [Alistipes sp.]|uniref:hypothetical protein n=1 Tax=Alistipes sp. TaxID=1872444 RepID=UPI0023F17FF4|nr:hypothetical protein [Alistipes sp.]
MLAREGMGVCVTEQADVPGAACNRSPAGTCDRHRHALHRQHAGRRHHAPLFRIFRHPRLAAPAAARRGIRRRVAARSGRLRLHARLRSLRKAHRGIVPARKAGLGRYCAKLREIGGSIGIRVHRTGGCRPGERNTSGHRRPDSSANASQTRCCAMSSRGRTPSTEACAKARRSTTTR